MEFQQDFGASSECACEQPEALSGALQRDKMDAFLAEVGEHVLSQSVVGQHPLLEVWSLRFLIGFKWNPKLELAAEKFSGMVRFRVEHGIDNMRSRMEDGRYTCVTCCHPAILSTVCTKYKLLS